jgi:hypothetical protein
LQFAGRTGSTFPSSRSSPPHLVHEQSSIQTHLTRAGPTLSRFSVLNDPPDLPGRSTYGLERQHCPVLVRATGLSGVGFSRLRFRGLRDRICPRPCGTRMSSTALALPRRVTTPSTAPAGAGILTCGKKKYIQ